MGKKTLLVKVALFLVVGIVFAQNEADFQIDGNGRITEYIGKSTAIVIPAQVGSSPVRGVERYAFRDKGLTSVTIPNSVTRINRGAFFKNKLSSLVIPDSVTDIEAGAFLDNQLTSVVISNNITLIPRDAFSYNQLTSVIIPNRVTSISNDAFTKNKLTSITIGAKVSVEAGYSNPSFDNGFGNFYNDNGKKAGTYLYSSGKWSIR
jgi:hypothetical protein